MKKTILFLFLLILFVVPAVSWAQDSNSSGVCSQLSGTKTTAADLMNYATCLISTSVIPLIFALATAMFVWGVVQYVINADNEEKKAKGKSFMIWGIIALAVMVSVWGLVGILRNTFGIQANVIPSVQTNR